MKIALLYNEAAGNGTSLNRIRRALERNGHELVRVVGMNADASRLVEAPCELVVAAGGDGTVSAAARALVGQGVPLAILPLGTANNIARSLGTNDSIEHVVERWHGARRQPFDVGLASGTWGGRRFVEAVGGGLIPAGIAAARAHPVRDETPLTSKLVQAARKYYEALERMEPRRWTVILDGVPTTGDFLLLEILNIQFIGPNLLLSKDASPSDGFLCVVTAAEEHREDLAGFLLERMDGRDCHLALRSHRVRRVEIHGSGDLHLDDQLLRSHGAGTLSIDVEAAALQFLA
jgi:diacylglycerol kinase family enzyme